MHLPHLPFYTGVGSSCPSKGNSSTGLWIHPSKVSGASDTPSLMICPSITILLPLPGWSLSINNDALGLAIKNASLHSTFPSSHNSTSLKSCLHTTLFLLPSSTFHCPIHHDMALFPVTLLKTLWSTSPTISVDTFLIFLNLSGRQNNTLSAKTSRT